MPRYIFLWVCASIDNCIVLNIFFLENIKIGIDSTKKKYNAYHDAIILPISSVWTWMWWKPRKKMKQSEEISGIEKESCINRLCTNARCVIWYLQCRNNAHLSAISWNQMIDISLSILLFPLRMNGNRFIVSNLHAWYGIVLLFFVSRAHREDSYLLSTFVCV